MDEEERGSTGTTAGESSETASDEEETARHDQSVSASEAFEMLGHEIRMGIVKELADCRRDNWFWFGKRFAELRKAVGVSDAGKFSYHLEQLQPQFVVQDGEEYKLTFAGMQVAGAITAGTYTASEAGREAELDVECLSCGEPLIARYDLEYCRLFCPNHGDMGGVTLPPGAAADRTLASLARLVARESRRSIEQAKHGVCPHCWGRIRGTLPAPDVMPDPRTGEAIEDWRSALSARFDAGESTSDFDIDARPAASMAQFDCEQCGMRIWWPVMLCVLDHPAVIGFCYEHGVDLRDEPLPALPFMQFGAVAVESEDPLRVSIDIAFDEETLTVVLDDTVTVVDHERH